MLDKFSRKYLSELFHYVGIGFVWWAMSHWFFSWERSFYMAGIWFTLFILWEILGKKENSELNYWKILFVWVVYSVSIWMVNGGFQHFLESPERSLLIVPIGFIISILVFKYKEKIEMKEFKKSLALLITFWIILTSSLFIAYKILPSDSYNQIWWHWHWSTINSHNEKSKVDKKEVHKTIDVKEQNEVKNKIIMEEKEDSHNNDWH